MVEPAFLMDPTPPPHLNDHVSSSATSHHHPPLPIASCLYCHLNTTVDTYPPKCMCIHTCIHTHRSLWHHTKSKYPFDHIFHHFIFENFIYDSDILIWSLRYFSLSNSSLQSTILMMHVVFITLLVEGVFESMITIAV